MSPAFREELTALRQIEKLGFQPSDVRHIMLTHLDFDHAGGLDDFPQAQVHMLASEHQSAMAQKNWLDRQRYRPQQWSYQQNWRMHEAQAGEPWYGFSNVLPVARELPDVLLVPLPGHTLGHAGVAVHSDGRWLLYAGDSYFHYREMDPDAPWCTPGLRIYQTLMEKDRAQRLHNQARLRELVRAQSTTVDVFCAHDNTEFERLAGRATQSSPTACTKASPAKVQGVQQ